MSAEDSITSGGKSEFVCEDGRRKNVRKPQVILRRIRGGREYGSGSGSVIWERRKRNGMWLKTISKRTIRLRSGIRFAINATSHSFKSFRQITPSHCRHIPDAAKSTSNRSAVFCAHPARSPHSQMQDFESGVKGDLCRRSSTFVPTSE